MSWTVEIGGNSEGENVAEATLSTPAPQLEVVYLGRDYGSGTLNLNSSGSITARLLQVGLHGIGILNQNDTNTSITILEHIRIDTDGIMNLRAGSVITTDLEVKSRGLLNISGGQLAIDGGSFIISPSQFEWSSGILKWIGNHNFSEAEADTISPINDSCIVEVTGTALIPNDTIFFLSGGLLDTASLIINGTISGNGLIMGPTTNDGTLLISGGTLTIGDDSSFSGFRSDGQVIVESDGILQVLSRGFATFGDEVQLNGGTLEALNGATFDNGSSLSGHGLLIGRVSAEFGSIIVAEGNITLGDANSLSGFYSDGELYTDNYEVIIHDRNEAILGSLTVLGNEAGGGTLTAGTANPTDSHSHFVVEQGKNVIGNGTVNGHFENHGNVIGNGTAINERIMFADGWTVSGTGTFENTLVMGTFAPGDGPSLSVGKNQAFGGTVEILLGGPTPGSGGGSHSQINDSAMVSLLEDSTLSILPWSNYVPNQADDFVIMTWQESLEEKFSEVMIDPWFAENDIEFFWYYDNLAGPGSLVLVRGRAGDPDFNDDGNVDHEDYEIWKQGFGTQQGSMFGDADLDGDTDGYDFLIWQVQYRNTDGSVGTITTVPEPTSIMLLFSIAALTLTRYRMGRSAGC
ncbi:MAG: hypothetical protein JXM70_01495 [Pirellulales bacterium]|nr:hypothetical protein [Pirellulales bacterium]